MLRRVDVGAEVVVHVDARRNAHTDALDAGFMAAIAEWAAVASELRSRGERPPNPPAQPGELLATMTLSLTDDVGTTYRWNGSQAAGTGTEWNAIWRFVPAPPPDATQLWVAIDDVSGKRCAVPLTPLV